MHRCIYAVHTRRACQAWNPGRVVLIGWSRRVWADGVR